MKFFNYILLAIALCCTCNAALSEHESYYHAFVAKELGGETEVAAKDDTCCDIVTDTHAIEADFKGKWAEALGQSLNYAFQLNKEAAIALIIEDSQGAKESLRLKCLIVNYKPPRRLWLLGVGVMKLKEFKQ